MEIIDDNDALKNGIERYLSLVDMPPETQGFTFINVNVHEGRDDGLTDKFGTREALRRISLGEKVVLYGFESAQLLYSQDRSENTRFMKVMAQPTSLYIQVLRMRDELTKELAEPKFYHLAMDLIGDAVLSENVAGVLLHGLVPETRSSRVSDARRNLGLKGTDEEVIEELKRLRNNGARLVYSGIIPGMFVDVEGTLMSKSERINDSVLERMIDYSRTGPVTIWTGGNLKDIQELIGPLFTDACIKKGSRLYTRTPIFNKNHFRGCTVELVLDNEEEETFFKGYEIKTQKYVKVKDDAGRGE